MTPQTFALTDFILYVLEIMADEITTRMKIVQLKKSLRNMIEPDNDFINGLLSAGVLTDEQFQNIMLKDRTVYDKIDRLLSYITESDNVDYSALMSVLIDTGQRHIVNFIQSGGGNLFFIAIIIIRDKIILKSCSHTDLFQGWARDRDDVSISRRSRLGLI